MVASQDGHQQMVELLLNEKADPNIQHNDGTTALMVASEDGHQQVVELLLNEKADPNIQHNDGATALMVASQNGHQQVVELLLNEKADPNIQHNDGTTALMAASQNGHQQVVELLSATKSISRDKKIEVHPSHQQNTSQHDVTDKKKKQDKHARLINDDEYSFKQKKPEFPEKIKVRAAKFIKIGSLIFRNPLKGKKMLKSRNIII